MREMGNFGKPQGAMARVDIGQAIKSICTNMQDKEHVTEAQFWVRFKFPGCQKIHTPKKWCFTKFMRISLKTWGAEKRLIPVDCWVTYVSGQMAVLTS